MSIGVIMTMCDLDEIEEHEEYMKELSLKDEKLKREQYLDLSNELLEK